MKRFASAMLSFIWKISSNDDKITICGIIFWWLWPFRSCHHENYSATFANKCKKWKFVRQIIGVWVRCNCGTVSQLYLTVRCTQIGGVYWYLTTEYNCDTVSQLHHKFSQIIEVFCMGNVNVHWICKKISTESKLDVGLIC